jgi:hypothetical protein
LINSDRRILTNIQYIFWFYRVLIAQRLLKAGNTNLSRYRIDANITAEKMISDREMLKKAYFK